MHAKPLEMRFKSVPTLVPPVLREVGKLAVGVASVSSSSGSATGKFHVVFYAGVSVVCLKKNN